MRSFFGFLTMCWFGTSVQRIQILRLHLPLESGVRQFLKLEKNIDERE